ncbi:MAG TPA: lipase maturation factor family protein, partial [Nannocystaceae bacterium]|nr:lipase maturation factor family protein [Nannocystaceae bacterium]
MADDDRPWESRAQRLARRLGRALAGPPVASSYWLVRELFVRWVGGVYFVAFASAAMQLPGLIGERGLLPVGRFLAAFAEHTESAPFVALPTIFWIDHSDPFMVGVCVVGAVLALAVVAGFGHVLVLFVLWALYLSIDHVGQRWYAFGWESQLLETGFLALFLAATRSVRTLDARAAPSIVPIVLGRWLVVRIMIGAGLIKLRGDPCWTELTCLQYHFETQPIPSPGGWLMHHFPGWMLAGGVLFNHIAELGAPIFAFGPRRMRHVAGLVLVAFQLTLIVSGNLSFLNWITIAPCILLFDDALLRRVCPRHWRARVDAMPVGARPPPEQRIGGGAYAVLVTWLSLPIVVNLASPGQAMNRTYDRLSLVNTYGAFGSVGDHRLELVIEGTLDAVPSDDADWRAYELPCKPGDPRRRPCQITPWHDRLDWLMWFAALEVEYSGGGLQREAWVLALLDALLRGEPAVLALVDRDPFAGTPPRFVRVTVWRYEFTDLGEEGWWRRQPLGVLVRPVAK